uniref:Uncharacterized protein n=1 Tax=Panagrolaimus sp. ES5 TaxID=591445 RepID=A0AC34FVV4_9BILA
MKHIQLFFLCFLIINFVGSIEYHGSRRFYTSVIDGKVHIALHVVKEPVKLIFPKSKTFTNLVSDIKLYSVTENGKCEDQINTLKFKLLINVEKYLRGEIRVIALDEDEKVVTMYLYEKCRRIERADDYKSKSIDGKYVDLEGGECFENGAPFQSYASTKNRMELQVNESFACQAYFILPTYMEIENYKLPEIHRLGLNDSFAGHDETFWWKTGNGDMLPSGVSFDSNKNVKIDVLKSTKIIPYFFRIGTGQPIPSLKFNFGSNCNGAKFELFVNLQDSSDCKIGVKVIQDGYEISTKNGVLKKIKDSTKSPTLIFGENQVYVKVASPLSINEFET